MTATEPAAVAARPPGGRRLAAVTAAIVAVVLAVLVAVLAFAEPSTSSLADSPLVGRPAPALEGQSILDGQRFDLGDAGGEFVLVNFFDASCIPCRQEHPDLLRFDAAGRERRDASVVSVVFTDRPADVEEFFSEEGGTWPVLYAPEAIAAWGVAGVPESFLVGPEGIVLAKVVGGVRFEQLDELLARYRGSA